MVKSIHTLVGSEFGRHAHHQVGIHNGKGREHGGEEDSGLFLGLFVGDDGSHVHFGTGAGRRGDGHDGRGIMGRLFFAAIDGKAVVPDIAIVCHHERNALAAVHDRAAAECDGEITASFFGQGGAIHDIVACGIGTDLIKQLIGDTRCVEFFFKSSKVAIFLYGFAICRCDERLFSWQFFLMQRLQPSRTKKNFCRHIKIEMIHDTCSFRTFYLSELC